MPRGLQVAITSSAGQVHKFLDDGSIVIGSGSASQGITNKSATFFEQTRAGSVDVYGDLSASVNISASSFYGDGSNLEGVGASLTAEGGNNERHLVFVADNASATSTSLLSDNAGNVTYNPSTNALTIPQVKATTLTIGCLLYTSPSPRARG